MPVNLAQYYDGSFGGVPFWELFPSGLGTDYESGQERAIVHIPGSSTNVIQDFGRGVSKLALPVAVKATEKASLRAKVGSQATLVYHGGSVSAYLDQISTIQDAAAHVDAHKMTLHFLL